jgi:hypothetical protein
VKKIKTDIVVKNPEPHQNVEALAPALSKNFDATPALTYVKISQLFWKTQKLPCPYGFKLFISRIFNDCKFGDMNRKSIPGIKLLHFETFFINLSMLNKSFGAVCNYVQCCRSSHECYFGSGSDYESGSKSGLDSRFGAGIEFQAGFITGPDW